MRPSKGIISTSSLILDMHGNSLELSHYKWCDSGIYVLIRVKEKTNIAKIRMDSWELHCKIRRQTIPKTKYAERIVIFWKLRGLRVINKYNRCGEEGIFFLWILGVKVFLGKRHFLIMSSYEEVWIDFYYCRWILKQIIHLEIG